MTAPPPPVQAIPVAYATYRPPTPPSRYGAWIVHHCPFCNDSHEHGSLGRGGGNTGGPQPHVIGYRLSHCGNGRQARLYVIVEQP